MAQTRRDALRIDKAGSSKAITDIRDLVSALPGKKAAIYTIENGVCVKRPYGRLHEDVEATRGILRGWGVAPGTRVGIYAPNSYHWLVHDLALMELGAISIPFTDDFQGSVNEALVERYGIALLLISKSHARLFADKPEHVAYIDCENAQVRIIDRPVAREADRDDQLSHVFSSGSAGGLKGLVISRKGVLATLPPMLDAVGLTSQDRLLLFLPMSNFQQRYLCYGALWYDFDIILVEHADLFAAMKQLNPTVLVAPPVLYQMLQAEILRLPSWKRAMQRGLGAVLSVLPFAALRRAVARKLFSRFYDQFGNNIRLLITGMAPIQQSVGDSFRRMQLPLSEAYGMVEVGVMAFRPPGARNRASVGKPLRDVEFSFEADGEIIVKRSHPVALRYFQCVEGENDRTFLGQGRIATGDMGKLDADGSLILLGRKKSLIVLPNGQKIHPETIETKLNDFADIANSVVFQKRDSTPRCVIVLNKPGNEDAQKRVRKFLTTLGTGTKAMPHLEVVFAQEPFSRENGMLRPSMKIDRKRITAEYEF